MSCWDRLVQCSAEQLILTGFGTVRTDITIDGSAPAALVALSGIPVAADDHVIGVPGTRPPGRTS
jgi:hypothetical protein